MNLYILTYKHTDKGSATASLATITVVQRMTTLEFGMASGSPFL